VEGQNWMGTETPVFPQITIDTAPWRSADSVWHDDEDENIEIDLTKTNRLKKLRKSDQDPTVVSGEVLTNVLQERWVTSRFTHSFSALAVNWGSSMTGSARGNWNGRKWRIHALQRSLKTEALTMKVKQFSSAISRYTCLLRRLITRSCRSLDAQYVFLPLLVVYLCCTFTHCADLQVLQQSGSMVGRSQTTTTKAGASAAGRKGSAKNKKRGNLTHYLEDTAAPYLPLPAGQVNIQRLVNANIAEPSKQKITGTVHGGWMFAFADALLCTLLYVRNESDDLEAVDAAAVVHRIAYIILHDLLLAQL
jgi:hypothetical protein